MSSVLRVFSACTLVLCFAQPVVGQPVTLRVEAWFYGDNTEFSNPFREGETLLGVYSRLFLDARIGERAELRAGIFANERFGGESSFELVRPVLALSVGTDRSRFIFGTLRTVQGMKGVEEAGPDRGTLHGLLPPLEAERFSFIRPHQAGLQWLVDTPRFRQDAWINWQRLNTRQHREVFDAGLTNRIRLVGPLRLAGQFHLVHHGGQLFAAGVVSDSIGYGPGLIAEGRVCALERVTAELYGLVSHHMADRQQRRWIHGAGFFARAAAEHGGWRGHAIVWRAYDFLKEEGDPNYLSLRLDGTRFRPIRDYAEIGATRTFRPEARVGVEASARLHRIENHYEYSYRILGTARFDVRLP